MPKTKPTLSFEDLTKYDLNLLKSRAVQNFIDKKPRHPAEAIVETAFEMINAMGYKIVKDETVADTGWEEPKKNPVSPHKRYT